LRLRSWDSNGNYTMFSEPVTIGNFTASQSVHELNATNGGSVPYTSVVPFTLTETIVLKNQAGQVVRTLFNGARDAGTYSNAWDGRDDAGIVLPDGPYFFIATVTDGSHTLVYDLTNQFLQGYDYNYPTFGSTFDPYRGQPLSIQYTFPQPGRVIIVFTNKTEAAPCGPNDYCWKYNEYQSSGSHTLYWYGTDGTGTLRPDLDHVSVTSWRTNFPQNAVVLFGTAPAVSNAATSSPVFSPAAGPPLTLTFDVIYQFNGQQTVWLSFTNVSSGSTLRSIQVTNITQGHATVTWDGRADNGMWVAAGDYVAIAILNDPVYGSTLLTELPLVVAY